MDQQKRTWTEEMEVTGDRPVEPAPNLVPETHVHWPAVNRLNSADRPVGVS